MTTLYIGLGGREAMEGLASLLYEQMRHDDILAEVLDRIDVHDMHERLCNLLTFSFGGSPYYEGMSLRTDFEAVLADDPHYDRFATYIETALHVIGADVSRRNEAVTVVELMRDYVLNRQMAHSA